MTDLLQSELAVKIRRQMVEAIASYDLITANDRVLVAVSGGKDSSIMLLLLEEIRKRAPYSFEISPVLLDQKQPGFDVGQFRDWLGSLGHHLTVLEEDTYSVVKEKTPVGKSYCAVCSRLRRGILYTYAARNDFNKIALGHHRNDFLETLLMNLFFNGKIASMAPKLFAQDGQNIVIRPMALVSEADLKGLQAQMQFPIIPCNLCGSQENLQRKKMKKLVEDLGRDIPHIENSMLSALGNVDLNFLMDLRHQPQPLAGLQAPQM